MSGETTRNYIADVEFDDDGMEAVFTVPNRSSDPIKVSFKMRLKRAGVEQPAFSSETVQTGWRAFKLHARTARSFLTAENVARDLAKISAALLNARIINPEDPQVETTEIANVINRTKGASTKQFVDGLLREDREAVRDLLFIPESEPAKKDPYTDEEVDEIIIEAVAHLASLEETIRKILLGLGFTPEEVEGRNHWDIPVDDILDRARARDRKRTKDQQVATFKIERRYRRHEDHQITKWSADRQADYALLNPDGIAKRTWTKFSEGRRNSEIRDALFPSTKSLTCVAALMCMVSDRGFNLQTVTDLGVDDIVYLGGDITAVKMMKTRNHTLWQELGHDNALAHDSRFTTLGGLIKWLEMITRFTRHHHEQLLTQAGLATTLADKFFMTATNALPISAAITRVLPSGKTVEFKKLRLAAGKRGLGKNSNYVAAGQTVETADRHYLQFYLDDSTRFDLSEQQQQRLITGLPEESENLGHTVCTTGANLIDEDGDSTPCLQGPVACMACPNGVRLEAHLPILDVLAEDVCVTVLKADIPEWMREDVTLLQRLARQQIEIHPASFDVVDDEEERQQHRINLTTLLTSWRNS